jgi:hypothetical protein
MTPPKLPRGSGSGAPHDVGPPSVVHSTDNVAVVYLSKARKQTTKILRYHRSSPGVNRGRKASLGVITNLRVGQVRIKDVRGWDGTNEHTHLLRLDPWHFLEMTFEQNLLSSRALSEHARQKHGGMHGMSRSMALYHVRTPLLKCDDVTQR